jgi:undecaprenyl pyrophosphate phosphatase UppP
MPSPSNKSNKDLMRYAGLAMQLFVSLAVAVLLGLKLDKWLKLSFPLCLWLLPLLVIVGLIIKLVKETGTKRNDKQKTR